MSQVVEATLRQVYDSRGKPTVEATVATEAGAVGRAAAPSGASTGTHEVQAFPAGGVAEALATFGARLRSRLIGHRTDDQTGWDRTLHEVDGSPSFERIGGNTATALSLALSLARSIEDDAPLWELWRRPGVARKQYPAIVGNCLNGGRHAIGGPEFQEFIAFAHAQDPADSVRAALEVHHRVGEALHQRFPNASLGRGDEGGWVAPVSSLEGLEVLAAACTAVRDELRLPVHPGVDLAASEFFRDGKYRYRDRALDPEGQLGFLTELVDRFELHYVEDPFEQEGFDSFAKFTEAVGKRTLVVGDDLYTTSVRRIERGVKARATNSVLIKVNQVGTLTDTFAAVDLARATGWTTVSSHRSGDVPEGWLAHLAVASAAAGIKCGLLGGERVAKLNELLRVAAPSEAT
ncbi:MAG TPA: enolase C-terminal domain-like protein [Thermoplasmata archaeon]|nr:enolase C-terminal domain-like protein [Thermoplasmata archaeon]